MSPSPMDQLLKRIRACEICSEHLPLGPRPVVAAQPSARILLIGQAPGTAVHASGIPWDDPSGRRLREWLGVDEKQFYDPKRFAIVPMGFCYPGKGKGGDAPPRPECAPEWHQPLLDLLPKVELTLLLGRYALDRYLAPPKGKTLTEIVRDSDPKSGPYVPLVHPSPRNNRWLRSNPWFEEDVIPALQKRTKRLLK